MDNTAKSEFSR